MIEQGTESWLAWRKKGLGSSDAAIIMGISPYKTPHQLWLEKCSDGIAEQKSNFIFEKGHRLEAVVRARIELETGVDWAPKLYERKDKDYIRCSMDLANDDLKEGKETKFVGKEIYKSKIVPEHYICQIQQQYLVTGFSKITCVMITDDKELTNGADIVYQEIDVPLDLAYCKKLFEKMVLFREVNIEKKIAPELTAKDAVVIKDAEMKKMLKRYKVLKGKIDKVKPFEDEIDKLKEEIFKLTTHPLMSYGEIMVKTSERKGSVDYDAFLHFKGIKKDELAPFMKKPSITRSITC